MESTELDDQQKKIGVLRTLDRELITLSKEAKVYKKECNSIFFIANRDTVHSETKLELDRLLRTPQGGNYMKSSKTSTIQK